MMGGPGPFIVSAGGARLIAVYECGGLHAERVDRGAQVCDGGRWSPPGVTVPPALKRDWPGAPSAAGPAEGEPGG